MNQPSSLLRRPLLLRGPLLLRALVTVLLGPALFMTAIAETTGAESAGAETIVAGTARAGVAAAPLVASVASAPPVTPDPASIGTNPFIPEDANIGDCVSSVPRPECGSDERGGWHQYLTMLVLLLGTVFIGWRIARGVRSRDRAMTPPSDA